MSVSDSPHNEQKKTQKRHRQKETDDSRNQADTDAQCKFTHKGLRLERLQPPKIE